MKTISQCIVLLLFANTIIAQNSPDSLKIQTLPPLIIESTRNVQDIQRLAPVVGTYIYSGKKNEVIELSKKDVSLSEKYGRQIFAKIPGVFVYDMDGTGNQVSISTRGLDPHRGWEFNIRKDGILTNTDMYGYPASHYNVPMEAVERIQVVRGTASLQYGAQFGGMLNYITKQPDKTKPMAFESVNTIGSFGLLSTYNAASGTIGKFGYSAWFNKKKIDGYRQNSNSKYDAEGVSLYYKANDNLHLKLDFTHSKYLIQLAGQLTDSMFHVDPRMSTRSRNYYSPNIYIPSITLDWNMNASTKLHFSQSAVLGDRSSALFDKPADIVDAISPTTLQYANRQVDIDNYHSYTTELRILHNYKLFGQTSNLTAGLQYLNNDLHRRQQGIGTTGVDYNLDLVTPGWGRDMNFKTGNIAFFAENRWSLTNKFSINTSARIEIGQTDFTGILKYYDELNVPNTIKHNFPLFGISTQYDINKDINIYGGFAQSYRPVIFKDIVPGSLYEKTDKDLKDANGYNAEIGFRGKWQWLKWDVTGFNLKINKRMGTLAQTDDTGGLILYRTNIGDSQNYGIESFVQADFLLDQFMSLSVFSSTSYMDAKYENAIIKSGSQNVSVSGNQVESVPHWISRNGFTMKYEYFSFSALYSYTSESFADALNTVKPSSNGAVGLVPSYQILDINISARLSKNIKLQLNANNALDEHYFAKRPQFYPGPGVWPSDGRSFSATVSISI